MLNDFRQFQFALARHLRDPLGAPAPVGVQAAQASACTQDMVAHLCDVLAPAFPVTHALLGDDLWEHAVRIELGHAEGVGAFALEFRVGFVRLAHHGDVVMPTD